MNLAPPPLPPGLPTARNTSSIGLEIRSQWDYFCSRSIELRLKGTITSTFLFFFFCFFFYFFFFYFFFFWFFFVLFDRLVSIQRVRTSGRQQTLQSMHRIINWHWICARPTSWLGAIDAIGEDGRFTVRWNKTTTTTTTTTQHKRWQTECSAAYQLRRPASDTQNNKTAIGEWINYSFKRHE